MALDLGGGKTAVATAASDLPIVVGVPVSVIDVWRTECRRLGWTFHVCKDAEDLKTALRLGKTDCYILPYSMADRLAGYFTQHRMGTVLCDEAHTVANKYVTWSQAFRGIPRERTYLTTATPMRRSSGLSTAVLLASGSNTSDSMSMSCLVTHCTRLLIAVLLPMTMCASTSRR